MNKSTKIFLIIIILLILLSCKKKNIDNDIIWQKYIDNEIKNTQYYATKVNYVNYIKVNKKERLSKFEFKVNLIKKNNDKYANEYEYKFLKGVIDDVEIDKNNEEVKNIISILKREKRKSFFYEKNIKSKIKKTKKNELIDNYNCVGYDFVNTVLEENGKKSKETGTIWLDKDSGKNILYHYKGKLSLLDTFFLPIKMNIKINIKYNKQSIEKIINEAEIRLNFFKFYSRYNKIRITYFDFVEL